MEGVYMSKATIKFKNVTKQYKLYKNDKQRFRAIFSRRIKPKIKKAIDDVSFTIEKGESVALFGRNGAGKSTILKMITGVTYPTKGEIVVDGRVSALLELTAGFDPDFTGRENIFFRGQLLGIEDAEIKALEPEIIEFADLGDYIDQPVRTYSSGMKARLGFAINANIKPEILIVDEALSVGDKEFRLKCNRKIKDILGDGESTFLFVTHSTKVAKSFCKRGIVLKQGRILFDGEIQDAIDFYEELLEQAQEARKRKGSKKVLG
ncbi:ABC transporter ATP-binding protein [Ihubacter sp. rT4E-8]|uniref:ABC transporter ATP-binding protein n=2 Tax=unclassified Ihubacter TaxID=2633299 RepID=UPI003CEA21A9